MATYGGVSLANMQDEERWRALLRRLQQSGVAIDPTQTSGYAPRNIAGTSTPSQHAFGRALDINYRANPEGQRNVAGPLPFDMYGETARQPTTTIDPNVARSAASELGMRWGGDFRSRSPDPMHFELQPGAPASAVARAPMGSFDVANIGAPTDNPFPYGEPEPPKVPATDTAAAPTRGFDSSPGSNPLFQSGFGGFLGALGNALGPQGLTSPTGLLGMSLLAGLKDPASVANVANQTAAGQRAQQELALRQREAAHKETLFQQSQAEYAKRQQIFGNVFPNGTPDMNHPLLKGMTPQTAQIIYSLGPDAGLPLLGQYAVSDAKARADLDRKLELATRADQMFGGGAGPRAAAPGAPAPQSAAPAPTVGPPQAIPGPAFGPPSPAGTAAARFGRPIVPPAPATAAPAPTSTAQLPPAGVPAQPLVTIGNQSMPIATARAKAQFMDRVGMRDENLEKAIAAAEGEGKVPEPVRTEASKVDQAYRAISSALDDYAALVKRVGGRTMIGSTERQAVDQARANLFLQIKELHGLGAPQAGDLALLAQLLPDPNSFDWFAGARPKGYVAGQAQEAVDNMKIQLLNIRNAKAGAIGLSPAPPPALTPNDKMRRGGWSIRRLDE